ncbi:hypothetical protein [Lactococcus lactis]|jgi:predicted membrane protein|uniref:hypothetical protein n=1 Tax=Lactococcus lactis TaxID=1358 RepID=UPI000BF61661|nr:hypothetical protein [Lactococcus lactis]MCT1192627.1 hypothetical protein [Lactococcus lactis]PFG84036.1 hypothetical protein BW152_08325 [Lactococcus lactis]TNU79865.1 hypothetical protein FIB48_04890 [Lactococcus lactis subsp. lactis]
MLLSIAILLIIWGAYLIGKKYKDSFLISYDRRKRGLIIIASSVFLLSFFVFVKNDGLFLVVLFSILLIGLGIYYLIHDSKRDSEGKKRIKLNKEVE